MRIRLSKKVYSDLESAMAYYAREAGSQLVTEFYDEFKRCLRIIAERSQSFPVVRDEIRRINFHRFPYHILYRIDDETSVNVLVVKHERREPDFGLDR